MILAHAGGEVRPIYMVHRPRNTTKNVASSFPQQRWKTGAKLSGGLENKGRFHLQPQAKVLGREESARFLSGICFKRVGLQRIASEGGIL